MAEYVDNGMTIVEEGDVVFIEKQKDGKRIFIPVDKESKDSIETQEEE